MSEPGTEFDDYQLIIRAQRGEKEAFEQLVRRYQRRVYGATYSLVGNVEDAMDIVQETFIRAYRSIQRFEPGRPFLPWIYKIARNLGLSCLKDRQRTGFTVSLSEERSDERPIEPPDAGPNPRDLQTQQELESLLSEALAELNPQDREIIVMKDIQNFAYKDIAELLEIPIGTVMSRLYYARSRLRDKMKAYL